MTDNTMNKGNRLLLEKGRKAAGGALSGLGGLDVGSVKLNLRLAIERGAGLEFCLNQRQHGFIGKTHDFGALGLLLR